MRHYEKPLLVKMARLAEITAAADFFSPAVFTSEPPPNNVTPPPTDETKDHGKGDHDGKHHDGKGDHDGKGVK